MRPLEIQPPSENYGVRVMASHGVWIVGYKPFEFGYGGDWSKTPLGEILDGNKMQDSGYTAKCVRYNCQCDMEHL